MLTQFCVNMKRESLSEVMIEADRLRLTPETLAFESVNQPLLKNVECVRLALLRQPEHIVL
jgi:hypothetical protein